MIIGIVPTIRSPYKNQIEICIDKRLINFLEKLNKKFTIKLLNENSKINKDFKLIVFSGGNDLVKFSSLTKDLFRNKINKLHFMKAKKLKIPMLGICHGATYVANKFEAKFIKKKKVGMQKINFIENNFFMKKNNLVEVNSYKNYSIKKLNSKIEILALDVDKTIEAFFIKQIKFLGLMWHPERYKVFRKIDFDLIKNLL